MIVCIVIMRDAGAEVKSAPAFSFKWSAAPRRCLEDRRGAADHFERRYGVGRRAVGVMMNTFTDLPRYPPDAVDHLDSTPDTAGPLRSAVTIAQVAGELLVLATPILACLWWLVFFPVMFGLL